MKILKLLFYLLICFVVFVLSTALSVRFFLRDESTVTCPDIAGLDYFEAKSRAAAQGLYLIIDRYEKRKDIPYNRIIVQKPDAGLPVRGGRTIFVVVSDGPRPVLIPSLIGFTMEEAQVSLQRQNMKVKKIIFVPSNDPGKIIAQIPTAGEDILNEEGMVLIAGGRGKKYFVMPQIGKDLTPVLDEMDKKHIKYAVTSDITLTQGPIINIAPGTIFDENTIIEIKTPSGG